MLHPGAAAIYGLAQAPLSGPISVEEDGRVGAAVPASSKACRGSWKMLVIFFF